VANFRDESIAFHLFTNLHLNTGCNPLAVPRVNQGIWFNGSRASHRQSLQHKKAFLSFKSLRIGAES
jgi:hypothetical protein